MLRLENIVKIYRASGNEVQALKGISLSFRKNEFVSILGASGCGKTTTLNIIGGLDHYTSGDLFIDGKSTKDFTDRDWDVYRNHRIGFIFQSYNLIPHQTILENVSLALTIGGVAKEVADEKAKAALDRVGLAGMYKKKPNQLSGGQCQRVAIARALIGNPEILLADEPTGALDSVTSVQIMELIKEISKERLVIMVTHNPELAEKYSTRIIKLSDGQVISDSNPYIDEEKEEHAPLDLKKDKAKMSLWTAFKLSGKSLLTKAKRTALTIIASSIGIVGVSAVLAVSNGVQGYIDSMQDDMLSGNPIEIATNGFDLTSFTTTATTSEKQTVAKEALVDGKVDINFMLETLIKRSQSMENMMVTNDITQDYVDFLRDMPSSYYSCLFEDYGLYTSANLYTEDEIEQNTSHDSGNNVYSLASIASIVTSILNHTDYSQFSSVVSSYVTTFSQILDNESYVLDQYDFVNADGIEGRFPKEENEIAIVLSSSDRLTDFMLTSLGYYSQDEFLTALKKFNGEDITGHVFKEQISVSELYSKTFTYYPWDTVLTKNKALSSNIPYKYSYQPQSNWEGTKLKVVGVLKPKEDISYGCLTSGIYYTNSFAKKFMADSQSSLVMNDLFGKDNTEESISTTITKTNGVVNTLMSSGLIYDLYFRYEGEDIHDYGMVGSTGDDYSSLLSSFASMMGGKGSSMSSCSITLQQAGRVSLPTSISIYPKSFDEKYQVTDYLDKWNGDGAITLSNGKVIAQADREKITYTDNLEIIISLVNTMINIITIALICFTALSLVVSTVMIGVITYVSVIERIKEIGVIRAIGGRKSDVSHLFNVETFIIGLLSGIFGILITLLLELIINLVIGNMIGYFGIANLSIWHALIIIAVSVLLTSIAGLAPASSAARKDPVVALRDE